MNLVQIFEDTDVPSVCLTKLSLKNILGYSNCDYNFPYCVLELEKAHDCGADDVKYMNENGMWVDRIWISDSWRFRFRHIMDACKTENIYEEMYNPLYDSETNQCDMNLYFHQSIENKKVFVTIYKTNSHCLPTNPHPYLFFDKDFDMSTLSADIRDYKKQVIFTDEKTIGDLYNNAWKYEYNVASDCFMRLPDEGAKLNALNYYFHHVAYRYGGTALDRIADLSRLVLFLYSKVELTDEEKIIFKPIIDQVQSTNDIAHVVEREGKINEYINWVKNHVEEFFENENEDIGEIL